MVCITISKKIPHGNKVSVWHEQDLCCLELFLFIKLSYCILQNQMRYSARFGLVAEALDSQSRDPVFKTTG